MAAIDTHTIIEALIASGTSKEAAKVFVENFVIKEELSSLEKEQAQLATKMDIVKLESKIDGVESRLESKLDKLESKLDSGFNSNNTNLKWISFFVMAIAGPIAFMLIKGLFFKL